jgi:hypothetical protein
MSTACGCCMQRNRDNCVSAIASEVGAQQQQPVELSCLVLGCGWCGGQCHMAERCGCNFSFVLCFWCLMHLEGFNICSANAMCGARAAPHG